MVLHEHTSKRQSAGETRVRRPINGVGEGRRVVALTPRPEDITIPQKIKLELCSFAHYFTSNCVSIHIRVGCA